MVRGGLTRFLVDNKRLTYQGLLQGLDAFALADGQYGEGIIDHEAVSTFTKRQNKPLIEPWNNSVV